VSGQESVWRGGRPRQVKTLLAALPEEGWTRLRAGEGTKGPRWYDWRGRSLAAPLAPSWWRWLLGRRSLSTPTARTAYGVFAKDETALEEAVWVAGTRWTIERGVEAATSAVGVAHYEVRRWTGWYRHITLAMWALAR
jgi:SRSO17 transposase